jgi:putative transposase
VRLADRSSKFIAEFEEACKALSIALFVLPPARPQYNGGVERRRPNLFKGEFYVHHNVRTDSLGRLRHELAKAVIKYNTYKPYFTLNGLTPMTYIQNTFRKAAV